jgi:hypothetical protein
LGQGSGVQITPKWVIKNVSMINGGQYTVVPQEPIGQQSTSGVGSGATFIGTEYAVLSRLDVVIDGTTVSYTVPNVSTFTTATSLVTVNGVVTTAFTVASNILTFTTAPAANSFVSIVVFNSNYLSTVTDTIFTANSAISTYTLNQAPGPIQPPYHSLWVMKNGLRMAPPPMYSYLGDGTTTTFNAGDSIGANITVYIDGLLITATNYAVDGTNVVFNTAPFVGALITIVDINLSGTYNYLINGSNQLQLQSPNTGDIIHVKTWNEDATYGYVTQSWVGANSNTYQLVIAPHDISSVLVWLNGVLLTDLNIDYRIAVANNVYTVELNGRQTSSDQIIVTYNRYPSAAPSIAWRQILDTQDNLTSQALSAKSQTNTLSNVMINSSTVELKDITVLSPPQGNNPGACWIENELVWFWGIQSAPTLTYPNRGFITNVQRNRLGSSGSPRYYYNTQYVNGDGVTTNFVDISPSNPLGKTVVYVNGVLINNYSYQIISGTQYIVFDTAPNIGVKNIKFSAFVRDDSVTGLSHATGSNVRDAGQNQIIPNGYHWEQSGTLFQYSQSAQAKFLLSNPA